MLSPGALVITTEATWRALRLVPMLLGNLLTQSISLAKFNLGMGLSLELEPMTRGNPKKLKEC